MQVKAVYRYARISAFKAREVTREIQGKPVAYALDILAFTPKKAATLIDKTLRSAVANAENNNGADAAALTVKEAVVGEGPTLKRYRARARGGAGPIHKRTSHISITLTDELPLPEPKKRSAAPQKRKKSAAKKATGKAGKTKQDTAEQAEVASEKAAKAAAAAVATEPKPESTEDSKQSKQE